VRSLFLGINYPGQSLVLFFLTAEIEALRKRFKTYEESTKGIIEHYRDLGKVREVDSSLTKEEVGETVSRIVEQDLTDVQQPSVSGDH